MTELAALNVRITGDATGLTAAVNQAEKGLQSVGGAANTAQSRTAGLTSAFGRLSNVSSQTRARIQNTSFQLQDIAVQLQAGTRASTVFAQQLPQLLGGFGAMGAAVGALAGIGIPALAFAFAAAGTEAKTLEDRVSELKDMQEALEGSTEILSMSVEELADKYGSAAMQVKAFAQAQAQSAIATARNALKEQILALDDVIDRYADATFGFNEFGEAIETSDPLRNLEKDLGLVGRDLFEVFNGFVNLKSALTFDEQQAALAEIDQALLDAGVSAGQLPPELNRALFEMRELVFQANELEAGILKAQGAASQMTFGVPLSLGMLSGGQLLPPAPTPEDPTKARESAAKRLQSELDAVINTLMTQEEAQIASFQRQQETLQTALNQRLITQQEYNALLEDAQMQHSEKMAQIDAYRYGSGLQQAQTFFGQMATAMGQGNDKMLKMSRAFGAAEALINSWRAYSQTIADPSLPFFAKIPAAISVLAAGMRAVSSIQSGSRGSAGGASSASAVAPSAAQASPGVSRNVAIQLTGGDMFSRSQVVQLINSINEAVEDGAVVRLV